MGSTATWRHRRPGLQLRCASDLEADLSRWLLQGEVSSASPASSSRSSKPRAERQPEVLEEMPALNDRGYQAVLAEGSFRQLRCFIERLVTSMDGLILSRDQLVSFVEDCSQRSEHFETLMQQLQDQPWVIWYDESFRLQMQKLRRYAPRRGQTWLREWRKKRPPSTDELLKSIEAWEARKEKAAELRDSAPLTAAGYRQAMRGEGFCAWLSRLIDSMGGKVLRLVQLRAFARWHLKELAGLEELRGLLLRQTWILWPEDSVELQQRKAQVAWRRRVLRRASSWSASWAQRGATSPELIRRFLAAKYVDQAELLRVLAFARRRLVLSGEVLALAIRRLGRVRLWQPALALLASAGGGDSSAGAGGAGGAEGAEKSEMAYVAAVDACRSSGRWCLAIDCLVRAKSEGLGKAVSNAAGAALLRCRGADAWPSVLQLLAGLLSSRLGADQVSFGTALAACGASRQWRAALRLVGLMRKVRQLTPDSESAPLCSAAAACNRAGAWSWSLHLLEVALGAGLRPSLALRNCQITAQGRRGWEPAVLMLQLARLQPDQVSFTSACSACEHAVPAAEDAAWRLLRQLARQRLRADARFCGTLARTCASARSWQKAVWLLPWAEPSARQSLLTSMGRSGLWREARRLLAPRLRKADLLPALAALGGGGGFGSAAVKELLRDAQAKGWRVDEQMQQAAVRACRSWQEAVWVLDACQMPSAGRWPAAVALSFQWMRGLRLMGADANASLGRG
ncbi:unnamed protein product [Effrenium voratum]|uniref:Pentatricopeptide repeat-containing protein n=1 Tax=Effrenium voratum TaxID=2562239 RepID=A0AA36J3Z6_9DINO|nr:unnamed protein product [Effrenium voratum]